MYDEILLKVENRLSKGIIFTNDIKVTELLDIILKIKTIQSLDQSLITLKKLQEEEI